jgi:hypothetical protein
MIKQDYIMLIMNCKKYIKKAQFQKMTWLPRIPNFIKYYHVIGDPELDVDYKFDNDNNILWVKVEDDYNSLPKKVIRSYKAVNETFEFKYLFKTDDDQILANEKFFIVIVGITNSAKKIHYGGYIVDVKQNYLSQYHKIHPELPNYLPILKTKYCSGRFYFLSKPALVNVINKAELIEKEYLEDYAIGYNLDSIYKNTMINIATNNYFTDIENSDFQVMLDQNKI